MRIVQSGKTKEDLLAAQGSVLGACQMKCPTCGRDMDLEEKDTSSGRDMRTYYCRFCKERLDVDNGIALWKALSDARKEK